MNAFRKLTQGFSQLFYEDYWAIGIVENKAVLKDHSTFVLPDSEILWIRGSMNYFLADPHWLNEEHNIVICELLNFRKRKGQLAIISLNSKAGIEKISIVNSFSHHYSYPQVVVDKKKKYIVPESALDNRQKLLELDVEGLQVVKEHILLDNCQIVDPTVFYYNNKFWLFANPLSDYNKQLHIYYAEGLKGPWIPSKANPYVIENCRGAGSVFLKENVMYWPTQLNTNVYGGGIIIRRIVALDENSFQYETETVIRPNDQSLYPLGIHTLNIGKNRTLIDGKKRSFHFMKPINVLASRLYFKN